MTSPLETTNQLRDALKKLMPGFSWTVHKQRWPDSPLIATGIQSSGSNRTATVEVSLVNKFFTVRGAGYGAQSPWTGKGAGTTLAQAFRSLQQHYEKTARDYAAMAEKLQNARKA